MKLAFISLQGKHGVKTGREKLSDTLWDVMRHEIVVDASQIIIPRRRNVRLKALIYGCLGWVDGVCPQDVDAISEEISRNEFTHVFLDGSNLGRLNYEIRKKFPQIKIITFFHNVEFIFFWERFKQRWGVKPLIVLITNYLAERIAVSHSDICICMNWRDESDLKRIYGSAIGNTDVHVSPMFLKDSSSAERCAFMRPADPKFALFVGGSFYANVDGMLWYAKFVSEFVHCKTFIVGKDFELHRDRFADYGNIEVIGTVDDIGQWYANASIVVSPIFSGSGMKTKTAEAMQYGRGIIGTNETFIGYEEDLPLVGFQCDSAECFIEKINLEICDSGRFDPKKIRDAYKEKYSLESAQKRFLKMMASPNNS